MMYIRISQYRRFEVSEYWLFIPLLVAVEIAVVMKVRKNRAETKMELNKLKKNIGVGKYSMLQLVTP